MSRRRSPPVSPQGNVVMCLWLGRAAGQPDCIPNASGKLTAAAPNGGGDVVLTLRGEGIEAPDRRRHDHVPRNRARHHHRRCPLRRHPYPETNGIAATITPRRNGALTLAADWGGHPFLYEVELREEGGPGAVVLADQGPATRMTGTWPVTAPNPWTVGLRNADDGFGRTELDATIAWP